MEKETRWLLLQVFWVVEKGRPSRQGLYYVGKCLLRVFSAASISQTKQPPSAEREDKTRERCGSKKKSN
eukprot:scaffold2212_cov143-Cylindrotheca_fusiformis.AAC.11